jgi:hypothetical protein
MAFAPGTARVSSYRSGAEEARLVVRGETAPCALHYGKRTVPFRLH